MNDTIMLACGCFIMNRYVTFFCERHSKQQPIINDPLDKYLTERAKGPNGKDDNSY